MGGGGVAQAAPKLINPDYCPPVAALTANPGHVLPSYCDIALMRTLRANKYTDVGRSLAVATYQKEVNSLALGDGLAVTGTLDAPTAASILQAQALELASPDPAATGDEDYVDKSTQLSYLLRNGKVTDVLSVSTGRDQQPGQDDYTPTGSWQINQNVEGPTYHNTTGEYMGYARFFIGIVYALHAQQVDYDGNDSHGCVRYRTATMRTIVAPRFGTGDTVRIVARLPQRVTAASHKLSLNRAPKPPTTLVPAPAEAPVAPPTAGAVPGVGPG
jgi:L,D-transpeptidase catalytic domain